MGITRITSNIIFDSFLRNAQRTKANLLKAQEEIASGSEVQRPSDDPAVANRILNLRTNISQMEQFQSNVRHASSRLEAADAVLRDLGDVLLRVNDLALEGVNDTVNQNERDALATEINQLLEAVVDHSNASFGGVSLFAGNETDSRACQAVRAHDSEITGLQFVGDAGTQRERIGLNSWIIRNVPGEEIFGSEGNSLFDTLIGLRDALRRSSINEAKAMVSQVESYHKQVADIQADIGGRLVRLDVTESRLTSDLDATQNLLSQIQEVDLTEVISDFRFQETVYSAVLSSGARTLGLSLFSYL